MELDDALDERQPNTRALSGGIQFFKQAKDPSMELGIDAEPIVFYEKNRLPAHSESDLDAWLGLVPHIFGGIIDEILKDLAEALAVAVDSWQIWIDLYAHLMGLDRTAS